MENKENFRKINSRPK